MNALEAQIATLEREADSLRGELDALALEERAAGPRAPELTRVLDPLARLLVTADRLADAEAVARRALDLAPQDAVARAQAEVLLAEDRDIGRNVALKYLTAPSSDAAALARFVDEIRVVGSLEHPNSTAPARSKPSR